MELSLERNPQKKIDILIELTDLLSSTDPDHALEHATQALELADKNNNPERKLQACLHLSDIYRNKTDFRNSIEMGNKAKTLASDLDMDKEYAESLQLLALSFSKLGDFKKSANLNFEALRIFEELDDKKGMGRALNQIGSDYFHQEILDKALEYYSQSLDIARENNDLQGISRGLNNMAIIYADQIDFENVISHLNESIKINKRIGQRLWVGINYSNLGTIYRDEAIFDTAYYYFTKAIDIFTDLNNQSYMAIAYYGLSLYYFDVGSMDSSLYYAQQSYKISQENNMKVNIHNAVSLQRQVYQELGEFERAFEYCMLELQLRDSLESNNTMTRMSQLELLHEFDKREQENKIIQQRREYTLIIAGTSIVFMLLILVTFIIARSRIKAKNEQIKRRQLNLELETKNRELAANVMALIRKNEILSGMGDKLRDIQNDAVKEETKYAIKKIARDLQKTTDAEIWDEFEVRFNQVHGDFYEKLHEQFPDLSPNEHRLCAFLRLNMTTKEISELTGQRIDTLEIARWRLRKKLKITNTKTNLVTFLSEI